MNIISEFEVYLSYLLSKLFEVNLIQKKVIEKFLHISADLVSLAIANAKCGIDQSLLNEIPMQYRNSIEIGQLQQDICGFKIDSK